MLASLSRASLVVVAADESGVEADTGWPLSDAEGTEVCSWHFPRSSQAVLAVPAAPAEASAVVTATADELSLAASVVPEQPLTTATSTTHDSTNEIFRLIIGSANSSSDKLGYRDPQDRIKKYPEDPFVRQD